MSPHALSEFILGEQQMLYIFLCLQFSELDVVLFQKLLEMYLHTYNVIRKENLIVMLFSPCLSRDIFIPT